MQTAEEFNALITAIIVSIGGIGVIIVGVSAFISKIISNYFFRKIELNNNTELEKFRAQIAHNQDLLLRKRELYNSLIISMRVFIEGSTERINDQKDEFLNNYDSCYLWGSDDVITSLGKFIEVMINFTNTRDNLLQTEMKKCYGTCIITMRKDSGFFNSSLSSDDYKFITFQ